MCAKFAIIIKIGYVMFFCWGIFCPGVVPGGQEGCCHGGIAALLC